MNNADHVPDEIICGMEGYTLESVKTNCISLAASGQSRFRYPLYQALLCSVVFPKEEAAVYIKVCIYSSCSILGLKIYVG
jgi:hypothetical protein